MSISPEPASYSSVYDGVEDMGLPIDLQTWSSSASPLFQKLIDETKPKTIIEVGSWKGVSAIRMAEQSAKYGTRIFCIDTWLGSLEHMLKGPAEVDYQWRTLHGYPLLYFQFLTNVKHSGYSSRIIPVPNTSSAGAPFLLDRGIKADLIYIDGDHTAHGVRFDITALRPLLAGPKSVIFGDDYTNFPTVRRGVDQYAKDNPELTLTIEEPHWILRNK